MKVLMLSQYFSTTRGGGEYVFNLIAKNLVENNHKVWIITNKIIGENYEGYKNVQLMFVPPTIKYMGGLPPTFSDNLRYVYNAIMHGRKIIKNFHIDVIHSNNFSPALAGSILSSFTSKPHIITVHDVFSLGGKDYWKKWANQNKVSKINTLLAPYFEKFMKNFKCECFHTVSETTKNDLLKIGVKKPIYVIPNAIEYSDIPERKVNPYQFVSVGRLVFYKNLEVIIRAIEILKKNEDKVRLVIVGDGPHKESLENLTKKLKLENHVKFKGYVSVEEKLKLIGESNALLFPSMFEGFGLVILEAFSQKRPVLVSDVKPMSDIISNGKTGYVLNPHNENEWAKALYELIKNPEKGSVFGEKGFQTLKENYSSETMYKKILQMYSEIIKP